MSDLTPVKKTRIMILVNTLQNVNSFVYGNHCAFFAENAKHPELEIIFYTPQRMTIDMARNMAAKQALTDECDYLMFLDDDVLLPHDALLKLIAAKRDIVAGLVIIRGYPFNVMAFRFADKERKQLNFFNELEYEYFVVDEWFDKSLIKSDLAAELPKRLKELQQCDAVGFSCCLIDCNVLKAVEPPYFVTGPYNTEDVYFCMKATSGEIQDDNGKVPEIFLHTGIICGHLLPAEPIEWSTREKFKSFYAPTAEQINLGKLAQRDILYLGASLKALGEEINA